MLKKRGGKATAPAGMKKKGPQWREDKWAAFNYPGRDKKHLHKKGSIDLHWCKEGVGGRVGRGETKKKKRFE